MFASLPATVITVSVACGVCADQALIAFAPFLVPWLIVFVLWSLLVGPLVFRFTKTGSSTDLRNPAVMSLVFFFMLIGSVLALMGSVLVPFILLVPFWITALIRGLRRGTVGWKRFCQLTLVAMVVAIPVSYVVLGTKGFPTRHAPRPTLPGSLPITPSMPLPTPTPSSPAPLAPKPVEAPSGSPAPAIPSAH